MGCKLADEDLGLSPKTLRSLREPPIVKVSGVLLDRLWVRLRREGGVS